MKWPIVIAALNIDILTSLHFENNKFILNCPMPIHFKIDYSIETAALIMIFFFREHVYSLMKSKDHGSFITSARITACKLQHLK